MVAKIKAVSSFLPSNRVTNDDISKIVDTNDEWIVKRTGIKQRYFAPKNMFSSDLAAAAVEKMYLDNTHLSKEIDTIIVATSTPDRLFPSVATLVQAKIAEFGVISQNAFDIQAVCSGFVYGLHIANSLIKSEQAGRILLIGAETFSKILNPDDRSTYVLFGDGAGAALIEKSDSGRGIIDTVVHSDGSLAPMLQIQNTLGCQNPYTIDMNGREVFKNAVSKMGNAVLSALEKSGLSADECKYVIPHQANDRIIQAIGSSLSCPPEKLVSTVGLHANTSAASIPLALDTVYSTITEGDVVVFTALGAGLTWGSAVVEF